MDTDGGLVKGGKWERRDRWVFRECASDGATWKPKLKESWILEEVLDSLTAGISLPPSFMRGGEQAKPGSE